MTKRYVPSPTIKEFLRCTDYFQGIMGVVGSGKTSGLVQKCFRVALQQFPNADGIRRVRAGVIRNHYPELETTTIRTFKHWFGDIMTFKMSKPIIAMVNKELKDGTTLEFELVFIAIDRPEDTGKLRSLDLTFAVINEASEIDEGILEILRTRLGRFPPMDEGGPTWRGILADTNPPSTNHWWYRFAEEERPKGFTFFRQPPALIYDAESDTYYPNPAAENIDHLDGGFNYYMAQLDGSKHGFVSTMILGNYGINVSGTPVHPKYSDHLHVSREFIEPRPNLPILYGMDFGLNPAIVMGQVLPNGTLVIFMTFAEFNITLEDFMDNHVVPYRINSLGNRTVKGFGDPTGKSRSALDGRDAYMMMNGPQYRFPVSGVVTNKFQTRKEALDKFLVRANGIIIDPRLAFLREALAGGYRYSKGSFESAGMAKTSPDKQNPYSHVAEALQYLCMGVLYGEADGTLNTSYINQLKAMQNRQGGNRSKFQYV
jgi:hypothetical protein